MTVITSKKKAFHSICKVILFIISLLPSNIRNISYLLRLCGHDYYYNVARAHGSLGGSDKEHWKKKLTKIYWIARRLCSCWLCIVLLCILREFCNDGYRVSLFFPLFCLLVKVEFLFYPVFPDDEQDYNGISLACAILACKYIRVWNWGEMKELFFICLPGWWHSAEN